MHIIPICAYGFVERRRCKICAYVLYLLKHRLLIGHCATRTAPPRPFPPYPTLSHPTPAYPHAHTCTTRTGIPSYIAWLSASAFRAHGVVASHPLRMRKALGSNPSVSMCGAAIPAGQPPTSQTQGGRARPCPFPTYAHLKFPGMRAADPVCLTIAYEGSPPYAEFRPRPLTAPHRKHDPRA